MSTDTRPHMDFPEESPPQRYALRLYIAGHTLRSQRAIENLNHFIRKHVLVADVEVIDIYQQQNLACEANLIGAPTLVKELPPPVRRIMGDLSDEARMASGLGLGSSAR